jgi:hypothetical protein
VDEKRAIDQMTSENRIKTRFGRIIQGAKTQNLSANGQILSLIVRIVNGRSFRGKHHHAGYAYME